jgi:hyperosmotically inducible periplasmic protein
MKITNLSALLLLLASPIALLASPDSDHKIENDARATYTYHVILQDHVYVKSSNGYVTLVGVVQDKDEKALAEDTVGNLRGVRGVNDELTLAPSYAEHSDAWIAFKLRGQLLVKANVSATMTTIAVQDGIVTLGGPADTLAQKELTGVYANEIEWVKSVNNNMIVQDSPPTLGDKVSESIDDASITTQVKYALLSHKATSALDTKVTTNGGVSVITGKANSDAEKALVTRLAQDVRGVKSVSNNMIVRS